MKFDTLKASLLAAIFAIGCNGIAFASSSSSSSSSDSDSESDQPTRRLRPMSTRDHFDIQDKSDLTPQQKASALFTKFNHGDRADALRSLYKMLRAHYPESKLAAAGALLQIIIKTNPHCAEKTKTPATSSVKAFSLTTKVELDSCKIASMVERFARSYNHHLLQKAKADMQGKMNPDDLSALRAQLNKYSDLSYYINLLGEAGLRLAFQGSGTFDVMFDSCGNPCAGLCPDQKPCCKPCSGQQDRPVDKGTEQAIDKIIETFKGMEVKGPVAELFNKLLPYGTHEQKEIIKKLIGG